jgi:6,7-dimethyl-8-ribityllumazine synthase
VVVSRFNRAVTENLLEGARAAATELGIVLGDDDIVPAPRAIEPPSLARALALSGRYDAVECLGAVIRGETPHFDYVCEQSAAGIQRVALETGVPVMFSILTTEDVGQAMARAGGEVGNKGYEGVVAAVQTVEQLRRIRGRI